MLNHKLFIIAILISIAVGFTPISLAELSSYDLNDLTCESLNLNPIHQSLLQWKKVIDQDKSGKL
jgi:hypothetical protein